jgi:uncharacterized protein with GYD domain
MATYITLLKYTDQGIKDIKNGPNRLDAARKAWTAAGGSLKSFYLTMGRYDAVVISELPDDATAAKLALATGSLGNVSTETLRAFTEDEFRKIVSSLP